MSVFESVCSCVLLLSARGSTYGQIVLITSEFIQNEFREFSPMTTTPPQMDEFGDQIKMQSNENSPWRNILFSSFF